MTHYKYFFFTLCFAMWTLSTTYAQVPERFCNVFGAVYEVDDPAQADFIVYEEASEAFAELVIYETDNELYADRKGLWFFTSNHLFARHRLYFTDQRYKAHFTVFFTDTESFAGCR